LQIHVGTSNFVDTRVGMRLTRISYLSNGAGTNIILYVSMDIHLDLYVGSHI